MLVGRGAVRPGEFAMPRFEILYHATCDLGCSSAEEAAAILRARMTGHGEDQVQIHELAVWREDGDATVSPLDPAARAQLDAFFSEVLRCQQEAEERFRGDVEAILLASTSQDESVSEIDNESARSCTK
jgi:hypothetical protein